MRLCPDDPARCYIARCRQGGCIDERGMSKSERFFAAHSGPRQDPPGLEWREYEPPPLTRDRLQGVVDALCAGARHELSGEYGFVGVKLIEQPPQLAWGYDGLPPGPLVTLR